MIVVLFDSFCRYSLFPLTFVRPVATLRVGILTIAEKWARYLGVEVSYHTEAYLQEKFPQNSGIQNIFINGSVCPNEALVEAVVELKEGQALYSGNCCIAINLSENLAKKFDQENLSSYEPIQYTGVFTRLTFPEDIFKYNDAEIRADYRLLTKGRISASLSSTNRVLGDDIFVEEGVEAECATFNTLQGPIYLGKYSQVWEGSTIRGSFALGEYSQVKMGAKIYGMTTIGPHARVGGEINNVVIFGYSSKGHEGFIGNSVVGEWCNLGADSNTSNLKNNYSEVALWDYATCSVRKTGLQFCGLIMGDHSKCSINTMFNTGTVVGVGANIFGAGFPPKFVPDFSWGGSQGFMPYALDKFFETAEKVYERRNQVFSSLDRAILGHVFELTSKNRLYGMQDSALIQ